jgi:methyl-accepting chemotaxis protein
LHQQQATALRTVSLTLRSTIDRNAATALAMANMMALEPGNIAAVAQGDRAALTERMAPVYDYLSKQSGVDQLQFQTADMKMLLRMQDQRRFGDDVSQTRPMVVAANHSHRGQNGIEIGTTGLSLRSVVPMMLGEKLVGTAEAGLALSPLIGAVKTRTGAEVAVMLSATMTGGPQRDRKLYGDLTIRETTDNGLFARILDAVPLQLAREDVFTEAVVDGATWGIVAIPMLDFSGRMIGGFVAVQNFSALQATYKRQIWQLLSIALGCGLVCFSVLAVAMRAFVDRPLAGLADWLEGLAKGQAASAAPFGGAADTDRIVKAATALVADKEVSR